MMGWAAFAVMFSIALVYFIAIWKFIAWVNRRVRERLNPRPGYIDHMRRRGD